MPHAAIANVVPQHHGRLVGGLEQHGVKKPPHRDLLPLEDPSQVGAAVYQVLDIQLEGDGFLVQIQTVFLHILHRHQGGHQLGQIPGLHRLVGVLLKDQLVGIGILQPDAPGLGLEGGVIGGGPGGGGGGKEGGRRQKEGQTRF